MISILFAENIKHFAGASWSNVAEEFAKGSEPTTQVVLLEGAFRFLCSVFYHLQYRYLIYFYIDYIVPAECLYGVTLQLLINFS